MARYLHPRIVRAYADLWSDLGVTHALTISLGASPSRFDPECDFMPILRGLVRSASKAVRHVPKRTVMSLRADDPRAIQVAGFYEGKKRSGEPFPHWHGGVALRRGEEAGFREVLWDRIGEDADNPLGPFEYTRTKNPLIGLRSAKPTFTLTPIHSSERYIRYANKHHNLDQIIHWTTANLLTL